jgi:antagonist of KipI
MGTIRILRAGLQTTVQDRGRWGLQSHGVPVAGPMDPYAHRVANALAGNRADAATLEVTLDGPEVEFDDNRRVAVSGAEFALTLDGAAAPGREPFDVTAGSRLRFGMRRRGARAYLAVSGGIDVPTVFRSRATHLGTRMGGFEGRTLAAGDRLPLGDVTASRARAAAGLSRAAADARLVRLPEGPARLRVLPGPQADRFLPDALEALQSGPYTIRPESDRMAFRLEGPALRHAGGADIISDATPLGALQVPGSGQPLLLMADRQTTGGYAKLATVITADIGLAGQLAPGDSLSFAVCTPREALGALISRERTLMALEASAAW